MNEVLDVFNTHDFYDSDDTTDVNCKINSATNSTLTVLTYQLNMYLSYIFHSSYPIAAFFLTLLEKLIFPSKNYNICSMLLHIFQSVVTTFG